ncbi:MAG: HAMP domain-containing histidine kinase [Deltaproteobacteria bacterium]|nr:HAMP domain-containing histidine kinase [Deltaproteobacteria bacterium]
MNPNEQVGDPEPGPDVVDEILSRQGTHEGARAGEPLAPREARTFVEELLRSSLAGDEEPTWRLPMPEAENLGRAWAEAGLPGPDLLREALLVCQSVEEAMEARGGRERHGRRRLRAILDEAVVRALMAHGAVEKERRDGWLSFYSHEMRNRLNTLMNATWLLRNTDREGQLQRICDMSDRAIKRMEATIREVRDVEQVFTRPPPPRPGGRG